MVLIGAVTHITGWFYSPYVFTIGATMAALAQVNSLYKGDNKVIKRLYRQQLLGGFFLILAGATMFFGSKNEWVVALTIGALIELYTSFRIPQEEKKESEEAIDK